MKVAKRFRNGWKIYFEPKEREAYRKGCKHNHLGICDKGYFCYACADQFRLRVADSVLIGCTPNVDCPILKRWDTRHGLKGYFEFSEQPDNKR